MNAETKAALERAAELMSSSLWHEDTHKDAALIRAHIASETGAHDAGYAAAVADVVAYLRRVGLTPRARDLFATAAGHVEAGAHIGAAKGGNDA